MKFILPKEPYPKCPICNSHMALISERSSSCAYDYDNSDHCHFSQQINHVNLSYIHLFTRKFSVYILKDNVRVYLGANLLYEIPHINCDIFNFDLLNEYLSNLIVFS